MAEKRLEIVEGVHHLMDLLGEDADEVLVNLCEQMLDRLDILAALHMEDYE